MVFRNLALVDRAADSPAVDQNAPASHQDAHTALPPAAPVWTPATALDGSPNALLVDYLLAAATRAVRQQYGDSPYRPSPRCAESD